MDRLSSSLSARFANMSFLCSCLVVFIHVGVTPERGTLTWWMAQMFTHVGVTRVAVPFFFLASGFFLMRHLPLTGSWRTSWRTECIKRVGSLLVPYAIWNLLYGLCSWSLAWCANRVGYVVHLDIPLHPTWRQLVGLTGIDFVSAPALPHLWYVRCLMFLVLLSPLLLMAVRRMAPWMIGILFVLVGAGMAQAPETWRGFLNYGISLEGAFYFLLGMMLAMRQPAFCRLIDVCAKGCRPAVLSFLGCAFFALRATLVYLDQDVLGYWAGWCGLACLMFGLLLAMPSSAPWNWARSLSFPLYLLHQFVLLVLTGGVDALGLRTWAGGSCAFYFVRCGIVIAGTLLLARMIQRLLPRFACLAFGGR